MAKISLLSKIQALALIHLEFVGISSVKTRENQQIAILQLAQPIDMVRGSQEVNLDGVMHPIVARDVVEVKVHENDMTDDFSWDEDSNSGEYHGSDLVMDVDQKGVTWLRKQTFAAGGQEYRAKLRTDNLRKSILGDKAAPTVGAKPVTIGQVAVDTNK